MRQQKKGISILGCGWLGTPLAIHLKNKYYSVKGSTTKNTKREELKSLNIDSYKIELLPNKINGNIKQFLKNSEILLFNIPPNLSKSSHSQYLNKIKRLVTELEKSTIKKVVYISSTSVYKNNESFSFVDEHPKHLSDSEKSKTLILGENLFKLNSNFDTTIIRFSGLIGSKRHPAHYLSGKMGVKNPNAPVNLINLNECIDIIESIILNDVFPEIFNASYPDHPKRIDYYKKACFDIGIPPPNFVKNLPESGKKVSSTKIQSRLTYKFKYPIL